MRRPVLLSDWLTDLRAVQIRDDLRPNENSKHFALVDEPVEVFATPTGSLVVRGRSEKTVQLRAGPFGFSAGAMRWNHPSIDDPSWHVALADLTAKAGQNAPSHLDASTKVTLAPTGLGRGALLVSKDRRRADQFFWEGPSILEVTSDRHHSAITLDASYSRSTMRLGSGPSSFNIWAPSEALSVKAQIGKTSFKLVGNVGRPALELDVQTGWSAQSINLEVGLSSANIGVTEADLSDWRFPKTPVKMQIGMPRAADSTVHLVDSISEQEPDVSEEDTGVITLHDGDTSFVFDASYSLLNLFRARDLLNLKFGFSRFLVVSDPDAPSGARLQPYGTEITPPILVAHFEAQHFEEEVYDNLTAGGGAQLKEMSESRAAAPSRIAFRIDEHHEPWPLTLDAFTRWQDLALHVSGRAMSADSTLLEQLDYVGIGKDIGRRRAMELIRESVEKDRDLDVARPDSRIHLTTAIEARYRMILSPSSAGARVETVSTGLDEAGLRGSQLWSARIVPKSAPSAPIVRKSECKPETLAEEAEEETPAEEAEVDAGDIEEPLDIVADPASMSTQDLRVIWVRGVDLGYLQGRPISDNDKALAPWSPIATPGQEGAVTFNRAVNHHQMRDLMTMTSVFALMAKRRLQAVYVDNNMPAPLNDLLAYLDGDPTTNTSKPIKFRDDPSGHVKAAPEGYTYAGDLLPSGEDIKPEDMGIVQSPTLGVSQVVMTSWGANVRSRSVFQPYADVDAVRPTLSGGEAPYPAANYRAPETETFEQESLLGEDIFVAISEKGFLLPVGHRASLVQITKREFRRNAAHTVDAEDIDQTAYLIKRTFITVGKVEKLFPALGQPFGGRAGLAQKRIRLRTSESPEILPPDQTKIESGAIEGFSNTFWPRQTAMGTTPASDVLWEFELDDDKDVHRAGFLFVSNNVAQDPVQMANLAKYYRNSDQGSRKVESLGKPHAFAPSKDARATSFATHSMTLSVSGRARGNARSYPESPGIPYFPSDPEQNHKEIFEDITNPAEGYFINAYMEGADQPGFYATVERSKIKVESIDRIKRQQHGHVSASYNAQWVEHGFDSDRNPSELFLDVLSPLPLDFSGDGASSGGFARPNMDIAHLSRLKGPIGGAKTYEPVNFTAFGETRLAKEARPNPNSAAAVGTFDPIEMLAGNSKVLGIFTLQSVLDAVSLGEGAPEIKEQTTYDVEGGPGKNVFERLKNAVDDAGDFLIEAIDDFLERMAVKFKGLAGPDGELTLSDLYPNLNKAYEELLEAIATARSRIEQLVDQLPLDQEPTEGNKADFERARDSLGSVVSGLIGAAKDLGDEIQAVIDDPVPPIVTELVAEVKAEFDKLRRILTSGIDKLIADAVDEMATEVVVAGIETALPFAELINNADQEAAKIIGAVLGYARQTETQVRGQIFRRVSEGLSPLPGNTNPTPEQVNAYIDDVVSRDIEGLQLRIERDVKDYVKSFADKEAALLRQRGETLLAETFGFPLADLHQKVLRIKNVVAGEAQDKRKEITRELIALVASATKAALESTALREVSDAFSTLKGLCEQATGLLTGQGHDLFGRFEQAEAHVLRLHGQIGGLKVPAQFPKIASTRGRALQATQRALDVLKDGKFLLQALQEDISKVKCLTARELEPVNQLFRLQASAIDAVLGASRNLAEMIDEIDAETSRAFGSTQENRTLRDTELGNLKKAIEATGAALKGSIAEAIGLGTTVDFSSAENFLTSVEAENLAPLKRYAQDFRTAIAESKRVGIAVQNRIQNITTPQDAVAVLTVVLDFASQQNRTFAAQVARVTQFGDGALDALDSWSRRLLLVAIDLALPIWEQVAQPVFSEITEALVNKSNNQPTVLGYLVDSTVTADLARACIAIEKERDDLRELRKKIAEADANAIRTGLEALIKRPLAIEDGIDVLDRLVELILSGQILDLPDLERLKSEILLAITNLLPVKVGVVFPWETKLGDFPPGKPIFEIATPEKEDSNGPILANENYWLVDDGEGGQKSIQDVFYPNLNGRPIGAAEFQNRRGDLVLDAGATYHILTGESRVWADAWLHPFTINVLPGFDVVKLHFRAASFTAGSGQSAKLNALPEDFVFGEMVKFIQSLSSFLSGGGEQGPYYDIDLLPPKIEVGVRFELPTIYLGPLIFSQISLNVSAHLPLDDGELIFKASVGRRNRPFLIAVPPYGGGGFIGLTANKRITGFEASMEYGGVVPLKLVVINGHGQVTAGIYIKKTVDGLTIITGFVRAIGEGSIGIFGLAFHIELSLTHINGAMYGRVFVSFTFSLKFFDVTFSFDVERKISGSRNVEARAFLYEKSVNSSWGRPLIRVFTPPRLVKWKAYYDGYPKGLVLPKTVASGR
ncbi:hypothetical protein [uncultured Pelagimonas sp.]|uniref:hypothetical protein n=1 Tax=uncultured Pelagimonas sp. TaxID=1618102 RepID=UPI0026097F0A|nr:hypothetical protein [uncultured Pelagimonas sp.]